MTYQPRLIIAGLSGGSGKTLVALGLARAWARQGRRIKPFKKGPDYIDAAWLGAAAGAVPSNLDPYIMPREALAPLFLDRAQGFDLGLVEGNRGLFDGMDLAGSCSTAELARILAAPVVLVLDGTKMTRTAAAVVRGCRDFEEGLDLAGVIVNRTAGDRHRAMLKAAIEEYAGLPVLGMVPRLHPEPIAERHMGLVSDREHAGADKVLDNLADLAEQCLDMDGLWRMAQAAGPLAGSPEGCPWPESLPLSSPVTIGYVRDAALWFYYEENLEALRRAGAQLAELSLLDDAPWPELHGLYLGGGFPETQAAGLAAQEAKRSAVRSMAEQGLPIYAECGGFMYLGASVSFQGETHAMAGVFPVRTEIQARPQGLGYVEAKVTGETCFFPKGQVLRGHEFHYSRCAPEHGSLGASLEILRGEGMGKGCDGLVYRNVFAAYTHIHALGAPCWAENFVRAAASFRGRGGGTA